MRGRTSSRRRRTTPGARATPSNRFRRFVASLGGMPRVLVLRAMRGARGAIVPGGMPQEFAAGARMGSLRSFGRGRATGATLD